jgi:hypothetical protein
MKKNREFINLGEFEMTSPVMRVSDPCYERDVWCCGTVDHCKLGTWEAGVLKTDKGEWGTRCAVLAVRHKDTGPDFNVIRLGKVRKVACKCVEQSFEVGVDSGQAGFFDDAFYQNDTVFEELPAPGFAIGDLCIAMCATSHSARCQPACCLMVRSHRQVSAMAAIPAIHTLMRMG